MRSLAHALSVSSALLLTGVAQAQTAGSPELEACKATGLMALKERLPSVKDIILDAESRVRTIIMGEAYLERIRNR